MYIELASSFFVDIKQADGVIVDIKLAWNFIKSF